VRIVPAEEWTHGEAKGICEQLSLVDVQPLVEVRDRENEARPRADADPRVRPRLAPLRRRRRHRAVETRSRGRSRRVRRRALLRTRHQWVGILPRSLGSDDPEVVRERLDGSVGRQRNSSTCSKSHLLAKLVNQQIAGISLFRWLSFLRRRGAKAHSHLRRARLNFCQGRIPRGAENYRQR